jgi:cytochrome c556
MKSFRFAAAALLGCALIAPAQDEAEFQKWMKDTGAFNDMLRKSPSKTGAEIEAGATKVSGIYVHMKGFWEKRNVADAVKWSEEGKAAADALASAAKAGDEQAATAAMKLLGGGCRSCHDAHREKLPDGTYKIK